MDFTALLSLILWRKALRMKKAVFYFLLLILVGCASGAKKVVITEGGEDRLALPSTHEPLEDLGNAHSLREDNRILRGAAPEGRLGKLKEHGVTDVVIFRDGVADAVEREKTNLKKLGYAEQSIHHIPMKWRKFPSFKEGCENAVAALQIMQAVENDPKKKLYLHCTMGEDRTGMIAGLYRMVFQGWTVEQAFKSEMCARGFSEANPRKPEEIAAIINGDLKLIFARMAAMSEAGVLNSKSLSVQACSMPVSETRVRSILEEKCL